MKFSHWLKEVIRSIRSMERTGSLKTWTQRAVFAIWIFATAVSPLRAQVVADGATVTLANVTNTVTGSVTVGTNGSFTLLSLADNALLTNSAHGVIGRNATARSNEVQLVSPGARWLMGNNLLVGSNGAFNRLVVSNSAFVNNNMGLLGHSAASSNNFALVTGAGSLWSNRVELFVGSFGPGNQLIVSNGARVVSASGSIGNNPGSSNNLAVVTGSGSVWTNHQSLEVGGNGGGRNRLIIEAGGKVGSDDSYIGSSEGYNEALVTGPGSLWSIRTDLAVGLNPSNNRLVVSNGAAVVVGNNGRVGVVNGSTNNEVIVTGAGSLWSNQFELFVGEGGPRNRMEVNSGGRAVSSNTYVGYFGASNFALVTGAGSVWSNRASMLVGGFGRNNQLIVSNGGAVVSGVDGFLGHDPGSSNNAAVVTGAGSLWTNGGALLLGYQENRNQLVVSNGGVVVNGIGHIGYFSISDNNLAVVTGAGSVWNNRNTLNVGFDGSGNRLEVRDGGVVSATNLQVGLTSLSANNRVVVDGGTLRVRDGTGTGALDVRRGTNVLNAGLIDTDRLLLTNAAGRFEFLGGTLITRGALMNNGAGMLVGTSSNQPAVWDVRPGVSDHAVTLGVVVGYFSSGHQLLVSGGALLTNGGGGGFVGLGSGADANANAASVSGANSRWRVGADVFVGAGGAFNQLTVSDGGFVGGTAGRVSTSGSGSNAALVTGIGSIWSNAAALVVGEVGPGNQLQILGGGLAVSASGSIGQNATANANSAQVSDAGSEWRLVNNLEVGSAGSFNQLLVSGGARISDYSGLIGGGGGSNNAAVVTGAGSLWSNASAFVVGSFGKRSQLTVIAGGMVTASSGAVGDSSDHNHALVTGAGSVWSNAFNLNVGYFGHSNRLVVKSGGLLVSDLGSIGETGRSNEVTVADAGSLWQNRLDLTVGFSGLRNQLLVSDGGTALTGGDTRIGSTTVARSNAVVVGGPGAQWLVTSNLYVGERGSFNRLVVSNSGFVGDNSGFVGFDFESSNNLALITGPGSVWSNASFLFVGLKGDDNQLVVSNGGRVTAQSSAVGYDFVGSNERNLALVTGAGSVWENRDLLVLGGSGRLNALVVSNAGQVLNNSASIETASRVTVTDAGSVWSNRFKLSMEGNGGQMDVRAGGAVVASNILVGEFSQSTNNRVVVDGGTLRAASPGGTSVLDVRRGTNVLNAGLVDVDKLVLTNRGILIPAVFLPSTFGNGSSNNLGQSGPAAIYPSTIPVAGLTGSVTKVTVTLSNLSYSVDASVLDVLLVGPAGQKVMLMSHAGAVTAIVNARLTFDDGAIGALPQGTAIFSGTFRPSDYGFFGDDLPSPAPSGPYSTSLSSLNGSNPNGVWSLYIQARSALSGSLQGWSVKISTDVPAVAETFGGAGAFELNGGTLVTRGAVISNELPFIVGGPGGVPAVWEARAGLSDNVVASDLLVGSDSSFNRLVIPSGVVAAGTNVIVGVSPSVSTNNFLHVTGGTLRVLTPGAALDVRGGTNRLDSGLVDVARLVVTNTRGQFEFNGGTLRTAGGTIANGRVFTVGGGASLATLQLLGGTHLFSNNLVVANNGSLIGSAAIDGTVTVAVGGRLVPGAPIGQMDVDGSVILQGTVNLQIDKSGGVRTSDEVMASGAIFYGGTLNVTDIGTDVLAAGDRFFLFDATPYIGAFTTLNLPPLLPGLLWQNKLSVDGSIEVMAGGGQPGIASILRTGNSIVFAGTNGTPGANYTVLASTNVALPATNWTTLATRQFDASGAFSFTNAITPAFPQRFFRLRVP